MTHYTLEPAANAVLDDIYAYTLERWGEAQADHYLSGVFATFADIANGRAHARDAAPVFGIPAQFCRFGHHYIYWKTLDDGRIGIMAIIHESRQQAARFAEVKIDNDQSS